MTNGYVPATPQAGPGQESTIALPQLLRAVRRNRWVILGVIAATLAAAALVTYLTRPVYSSEGYLRIENSDAKNNLLGDLPSLPGTSQGEIETEMLVLRSRELATRVTDSLGLRVMLTKPVRPRAAILRVIDGGSSELEATIRLEPSAGGAYTASVEDSDRPVKVPSTVTAGVPFRVGDVTLVITRPATAQAETIEIAIEPYRETVQKLREDMLIVRPEQDAQVIKLSYRSTDSVLVADVPNALAAAFIAYKAVTSRSEENSTVEFLQGQVAEYATQVENAEVGLRDYSQAAQVVAPEEQATLEVRRIAEVQATRDALKNERDGLSRLITAVQDSARAGDTSPFRQLASFPTFFANKAVQDMLASLNQLENQRAQLRVRRTPTNEDVRSIDQEIKRVETSLFTLTRSYLENIDAQLNAVNTSLAAYGSGLQKVPQREMEYARHVRQATLVGELYKLLQTRLKEAQVRAAVEPGDVRVIDSAIVPVEPVAPRPFRNMLLGLFIGLVLAAAATYVRESSSAMIRSQDEITEIAGELPFLGFIPHMALLSRNGNRPGASRAGTPHHATLTDLGDPIAMEAYRTLRTNLRFIGDIPERPVILIISSVPGEGKSTTASNLGRIFAVEGKRVILIDADLRRGHVHSAMGLPMTPGLSQVLIGDASLAEAVRSVQTTNGATLDVITAGAYPPNASELLGSASMSTFLAECRRQYDMVIIDAPPVTAVADAAILSTLCDLAVMIVRTGHTPRAALQYTMTQLRQLRAPVRGIVVNDINPKQDSGSYAYAYTDYASGTP